MGVDDISFVIYYLFTLFEFNSPNAFSGKVGGGEGWGR